MTTTASSRSSDLTWLPAVSGFVPRVSGSEVRWRRVLRLLPYHAKRPCSARNSAWSCMRALTSSLRSASSLVSNSASGSPAASSLFKNSINLSMWAWELAKALVAEVSAGSLIPVGLPERPGRVPARFNRGTLFRSLAECGMVAIQRDGLRQAIPLLELPLPAHAPGGAEWIEAYRHWAG